MARKSRKQEIGAEVVSKVQSGRTAREVAGETPRRYRVPVSGDLDTIQLSGRATRS
jgi:hypothetical protein